MAASTDAGNETGTPPVRKARPSGELHVVRDDLPGMIAHDLRTPLAAMSMNLDFALGELGGDVPEAVRAALEDCRGANARAVRIVSDMADAAQLFSGERRAAVADVDVGVLLATVVEGARGEAVAREVAIHVQVAPAEICADAHLLTRAFERILERAIWCGRGVGRVDVALEGRAVTVRVSPAPRGGASAARSLGTHFAEAALRAHGGSLAIDVDGEGLTFRLTLGTESGARERTPDSAR